ncbi:ABC transporter permease [Gordonibacter sp. An230]|uniref:ABC transporter permease n=1 Tax=Gordonibacter sp. An230 TaxID=1965592 RepID=UPI000B3989DF|nr:ABC transporter permease [Gordonibacter sp. An230]OUO91427.1 ABC transporter permease [Gordonibacter sp. An230]
MGIFTRFTLRSLAKNRVRTAVTVAGIALSTALLAAVLTSVGSMQAALMERTMATEGSWHVFSSELSATAVDALADSDQVSDLMTFTKGGTAALSEEDARNLGDFFTLKSMPTVAKGSDEPMGAPYALMPELVEGGMPQTADEVILPDYLKGETLGADGSGGVRSDGPIAVGSAVEADLGVRVLGDDGEESIEDPRTRTLVVTGFYERQPPFLANNYAVATSSSVAINAAGSPAGIGAGEGDATMGAYVVTRGIGSFDEMRAFFEEATGFPQSDATLYHGNLFPYLGISDGRPIWGTLWAVAAVLAVVIVAASVTLIYNSFAISVAERTRQFGLLASLGASKRQLRRTVFAEALVLGLVGVPLGLVLGVAGTAGAFAASSEAFASLVSGVEGVPVHVDPLVLASAAALSLATLVASAWVPALRASRVSAVDAIRQTQDVRLSRRAARRGAAGAGAAVKLGWRGKLFGVPGFVAHRNLSRSASRGRTVVASLAVSVVLIVATGSLADALAPIADRAGRGGAGSGADVTVSAHMDSYEQGSTVDLHSYAQELDRFLEQARAVEGLEFLGSTCQGQAEAVIPAGMISPEAKAARERIDAESNGAYSAPSFNAQGDYLGSVALFYLDDASWRSLVAELGQDEAAFCDPDNPRAIGLNAFQGTLMDGTYVSTAPFAAAGDVDLFAIEGREGFSTLGVREGPDGGLVAGYLDIEDPERIELLPLDDVATSVGIEVGALTEGEPDALNALAASSQFPALVLPESAAAAPEDDRFTSPFTYSFASFSFKAADHAKAAEELEALGKGLDGVSLYVTDLAESARQNRLMTQAIQLFVICFSVIMALIAVANVFNTLANSIILRTREFAVLKSMGMGGRAFARMLAYECASYAARGLAIGLVAATAVAWALFQATSLAFAGRAFSLPWPYVGAAVGVVLAVLAMSVAYALVRTRAGSIVEALRTDAI